MTQDGREMMAGRWRGILVRLDVRLGDALDQSYSKHS